MSFIIKNKEVGESCQGKGGVKTVCLVFVFQLGAGQVGRTLPAASGDILEPGRGWGEIFSHL